jgi:hypothetical protein
MESIMGKSKVSKTKTEKEAKKLIDKRLDILRALFVDHVKIETLNNAEIEIIVFYDDTAKNLKPVFDKYDKAMEFDKKDENSRLYIYMPLIDFYNMFESALVGAEILSLDDVLQSLIIYDQDHKFGHDLFLNIINDVRNPKIEPEIEIPFEPPAKEMRKFY